MYMINPRLMGDGYGTLIWDYVNELNHVDNIR